MSAVIAFDEFFLVLGGGEDLGKADAGVIAHLVEHPDGMLGSQIAGGAGSEGAAAQAAQSGLDLIHAGLMAVRVLTIPRPRVSWKWTPRCSSG